MSKDTKTKPKQHTTYSYTAIKIAFILAIVCIGINTYVLWSIYSKDVDVSDPTAIAVDSLSRQVDQQMVSIEQRLIGLERSLENSTYEEEISQILLQLTELHQVDELDKLGNIEASLETLRTQTDQNTELTSGVVDLLVALQASSEQNYAEIIRRIELLEGKFTQAESIDNDLVITVQQGDSIWALASRFENPPSMDLVSRIMEHNSIIDPTKLRVGQQLTIPENI